MTKNKIITFVTTLSFLLSGCGGGGGGGTTSPSSSEIANTTGTTIQVVRGPLLHATVKDGAGKAGSEQGNGYYKFSNSITYPITASGGFIDVDRDGNVSAGDITNTMILKTNQGTVVTVATTYDANTTTKALVNKTLSDLNISQDDLYNKTPLNSTAIEAISNILYKHEQDNNLSETYFININDEVKQEFNSYENDSSHDSQTVEQNLMNELVTNNKVQELTQTDADNENQTYSDSHQNDVNENSEGSESSEENENNDNANTNSNNTNTGSNISNQTSTYTLLAWNDLGMHCMDGSDFSVFSILPPYNNLNAQLIKKAGTTHKHVTSGVTITYTAATSLNGKYNTTSMLDTSNNLKTNFWNYVSNLFNTTLTNDTGLAGNKAPSLTAQPLKYILRNNWWEATGIPLTPYNDDGTKNYYPMVNVTAKDSSGNVLATTKVVLPVSDEMDCKACHGSTSGYASAKPTSGWENDSNAEKDFKFNILKLHDQKFPTAVSDNQVALKTAGYNSYNDAGLYTSAKNGNPVLCATCHASNALPGTGITGIKPLTESLHALHANALDPVEGIKLGDSTNRSACYRCHPGATTKCLRGAMGKQSNIQCQSCHGDMNAVGKHGRVGWLDEPNCQSCHQNGQRYTTAVTNTMTGTLRESLDYTFATNTNTPSSGISLYRFSRGHGDMQCSACHGSTHAIYPSSHAEDNLQSIAVQGHEGTISECTACHTTAPSTTSDGPHGMHTVGQAWISNHQHVAENNPTQCTACHGTNYRGSVLSKTFSARSFSVEHGTKTYTAGQQVTCYDCHNGPSGE